MKLMNRITAFLRDEEGVTVIEYALIAALIIILAIVAIATVGTDVNTAFSKIANALPDS